jgi:hypothetical protein
MRNLVVRGVQGDRIKSKCKEGRMSKKEETKTIGYYAEDGNIYCVECINRNSEIIKAIDKAITSDDSEDNVYICDGCKEEIK